jgi:hypothetical protein
MEPLGVTFQQVQYDVFTNILKVKLRAEAYDTLYGEYRFNVFITEDSIKAWQASAPDPMDYYHRRVMRKMLGGPWGEPNSVVPTTLYPGQFYEYEFQFTVPVKWNAQRLKLTGLLQKYNSADIYDRRILNSCQADLGQLVSLSVGDLNAHSSSFRVTPNPVSGYALIQGEDITGSITILNTYGQLVEQVEVMRKQEVSIPTDDWAAGVYFISYRDDRSGRVITRKVVKSE